MPSSVEARARAATETILSENVVGISENIIKLGIYDQAPNQEFFQELKDRGTYPYFIQIEPVEFGDFVVQEQLTSFNIPIKFYFAMPVKQDFEFLDEEDVVSSMCSALGNPNNWTDLPAPIKIAVKGPEQFLDSEAPAGLYTLTLNFEHS